MCWGCFPLLFFFYLTHRRASQSRPTLTVDVIALRIRSSEETMSIDADSRRAATPGRVQEPNTAHCHAHLLPVIQPTIPPSTLLMADAFADLWSTAAPSTSAVTQKPRKLADLVPPTTPAQQPRPRNDVFSLLAASSSSSNANSRTSSPGIPSQTNLKQTGSKLAPASNGDAFSELLSDSFGNGPGSSEDLSMAERAARVEKEKREQVLNSKPQTVKNAQPSAWAGLDSLGSTHDFTPPPMQPTRQKQGDFDWIFDAPASTSSKPSSSKKPPAPAEEGDDWGLSDFGSNPTPPPVPSVPRQRATKPSNIWDFEDVESSDQLPPPPRRTNRPNSPGDDFDFGNREDGLLDNDSNDEDDILGSLSKPVSSVPPRRPGVSSWTY